MFKKKKFSLIKIESKYPTFKKCLKANRSTMLFPFSPIIQYMGSYQNAGEIFIPYKCHYFTELYLQTIDPVIHPWP